MFWGKKKDHSAVIEKIALSMMENGQETGVLPFLSLKDAADYAKSKEEHPACSPGFVQCQTVIGDGFYCLEFKPHPQDGVYMSVGYFGKIGEL